MFRNRLEDLPLMRRGPLVDEGIPVQRARARHGVAA